jgi:RNA polymerase sigma-70 factor (ECF subfamily)
MLTLITVRKCDYRRKYFRAARRDVEREVVPHAAADPALQAIARDPTPSEAARLAETVELLMRELAGREKDILALSLQGFDTAEISGQVGRTERTVQRVLKRVRERLEQMHADLAATPGPEE